jgi:rhizosphere induced protein
MAFTTYSVTVSNRSTTDGTVCLYHTDPNLGVPDALPLAWLCERAAPQMTITFQFAAGYSFVLGETGPLVPHAVFTTAESVRADLSSMNSITLAKNGASYGFRGQGAGAAAGRLYVGVDRNVTPNDAAVGIGISGVPAFAVHAHPNADFAFTPHPTLNIAFGNFRRGEALDTRAITNAAQIVFPSGASAMMATLSPDLRWTVAPTFAMSMEVHVDVAPRRRHLALAT